MSESERLRIIARLAPRYMSAPERWEIVREVIAGERCQHGFPDQGECCKVCDPSDPFAAMWWEDPHD